MREPCRFTGQELKYLGLLAQQYPTVQDVCTEIINLQAILNLPKGTEHFMSDLHGEYEAFQHILNNCSGVIREKVDLVLGDQLGEEERSELCTLIYYPEQKLRLLKESGKVNDVWYKSTLQQMIDVCKVTASKYTRSKVRKALPREFSYIIDELLHAQPEEDSNQRIYHGKIMDTIISIDNADEFIIALSSLIKRLAVDHLHIVGDIFDRGSHADRIIDMLMSHHAMDIEWGNHDILWMGAASGSEACAAAVVRNTAAAGHLNVLESGYGIRLRDLAIFSRETYQDCEKQDDAILKAISIILFKLEGQLIQRHPEYEMENRMLLHRIDLQKKTVEIDGTNYPLNTSFFPTLSKDDPYALTAEEQRIVDGLMRDIGDSERLHRHIQFLYEKGGIYKCYNLNLLFHGCIPLEKDGTFSEVVINGSAVHGRVLMDRAEQIARQAYFSTRTEKRDCLDFMWYLWCGKKSPLFGREKITTFERMFVLDEETWVEEKNPYYRFCLDERVCDRILEEFGLSTPFSHIVNGHVPVRVSAGESPVKAGGKLIVIDGGFCKAYHKTTGIAGYTLIYNSRGMRIMSHQPFENTEQAILKNKDIESHPDVFETQDIRIMVMDTDNGNVISNKIYDLTRLLASYRQGLLVPKGKGGVQ